jgi:hypothetical protein
MRRLCRLEVRSSNEKSLLLLGSIADKFEQRIHGFGQAGGGRGTGIEPSLGSRTRPTRVGDCLPLVSAPLSPLPPHLSLRGLRQTIAYSIAEDTGDFQLLIVEMLQRGKLSLALAIHDRGRYPAAKEWAEAHQQ